MITAPMGGVGAGTGALVRTGVGVGVSTGAGAVDFPPGLLRMDHFSVRIFETKNCPIVLSQEGQTKAL